MTVGIVLGIVAVVVILVVVTRNSSRVKKAAKEDLKREMEELHRPDIMELVQQEAAESGVLDIPGGEGVELPTRLRVWHRDEAVRLAAPDTASLRYVVADGVDPGLATDDDLRLDFSGYVPASPIEEQAEDAATGADDGDPNGAEAGP